MKYTSFASLLAVFAVTQAKEPSEFFFKLTLITLVLVAIVLSLTFVTLLMTNIGILKLDQFYFMLVMKVTFIVSMIIVGL